MPELINKAAVLEAIEAEREKWPARDVVVRTSMNILRDRIAALPACPVDSTHHNTLEQFAHNLAAAQVDTPPEGWPDASRLVLNSTPEAPQPTHTESLNDRITRMREEDQCRAEERQEAPPQPALCDCGKPAQFCSKCMGKPAVDVAGLGLVAEANAALDAAYKKLDALCQGKETFTMHIPARTEHDHDLVFAKAFDMGRDMCTAITTLAAQLQQERERADRAENRYGSMFEAWPEEKGWCEHNHQFSYRLDDADNSDGCMQCERDTLAKALAEARAELARLQIEGIAV